MGVTWWNLQSQLLVAIQNDDEVRAKQLLASGVDCDARFAFGSHRRPAVCLCVERDSLALVRVLLDSGCSVDQCDSKGQTALHLAAGRGQVDLVDLLLQNRASVRSLDEQKRTALHWAALRACSRMTQMLLHHEAAVNQADQDGRTPLMLACLNSSYATALLLLRNGADAKAADCLANTALHLAVGACGVPDLGLIQALIEAGSDVNAANASGLTPLHVAVRGAHKQSRSECIAILAKGGSRLDMLTPLGQTALHIAVLEHDEASAVLLLRLQARADTSDSLGLSPLFHAAKDGNVRLVKFLLAAGGSLNNRKQWLRDLSKWKVSHTEIEQLITASSPERLTSLARLSFRSYAKEKSTDLASQMNLPRSLVHYINFADIH